VVLSGGLSHERDVSLRSGRRVALALRSRGIEVIESDVDSALVPLLTSLPGAVVFPVLHGEAGEDGALREVLALLGVPFVGSIGSACRVAFDKSIATTVVREAGDLGETVRVLADPLRRPHALRDLGTVIGRDQHPVAHLWRELARIEVVETAVPVEADRAQHAHHPTLRRRTGGAK
jgi:hypothetical protein